MRYRCGVWLLGALLVLAACQPRPRATAEDVRASDAQEAGYEEIVPHPYDATWSALNDLIDANAWRANELDKPTGRISLAQVPIAGHDDAWVCGSGRRDSYEDQQAHLEIRVKRVTSSGTRVTFDTRIDAHDASGRYSGRVECESTGKFEQYLLQAIDSVIVSRRQMD
ncbi:MAG: hypothetical protein GF341_02205 [candidate division Zixibacteria bacterium]|nr:hypothetical protein [candidate division Zixibacteria bacterium]